MSFDLGWLRLLNWLLTNKKNRLFLIIAVILMSNFYEIETDSTINLTTFLLLCL